MLGDIGPDTAPAASLVRDGERDYPRRRDSEAASQHRSYPAGCRSGECDERFPDCFNPRRRTVHAIDHVLLGAGAAEHLVRLRRITSSLDIADGEVDQVLAALADDPETYFLSAEGHNRWRGGVPYDEFPMRRCVSIQLCVPADGAGPAA